MGDNETILIIDDEPVLRASLKAQLETIGCRVLEAADGQAGIAACLEQHPDLVLLDIVMPGMDGFDVCACLKGDEALQDIPVIFLSGMLEAKDKVRAFRAGAVDYVTKPFHSREVEARVQVQLELLRQRKRLETQNEVLQQALDEADRLNRKLIEVNDRLCRSEALKGHFLANVRNEINNPLNVIMGLGLELEAHKVPLDRIPEAGGLIAAEASGLDFQLQNIFCAAELEAGESVPGVARVTVGSVLNDALEALRYRMSANKIHLKVEVVPEGTTFCTDAAKLKLVMVNLISNAINFSHAGGEVRVRLVAEESSLFLDVEDDGVGIRPEDQTRIFEPFEQLETGLTRAYPGKGLGLSVVQSLVAILGGTLALESRLGSGSRFTCTLPSLEMGGASDEATEGNVTFFRGGEGN